MDLVKRTISEQLEHWADKLIDLYSETRGSMSTDNSNTLVACSLTLRKIAEDLAKIGDKLGDTVMWNSARDMEGDDDGEE